RADRAGRRAGAGVCERRAAPAGADVPVAVRLHRLPRDPRIPALTAELTPVSRIRVIEPKVLSKELAMGLFDQLLGGVVGECGNNQEKGSLMDLATNVIQSQPGGLSGLLNQFRSAGLGQQADSWVSTGQNMPVSGDQVTNALGHGNVQSMSQKLGLPQ